MAMLAWHFEAFSGIRPYTIDQVEMSSFESPVYALGLYRYAMQKASYQQPVVFRKENGGYYAHVPEFDMNIFTPPLKMRGDYPEWFFRSGARKKVPIAFHLLGLTRKSGLFKGKEPLTIQVFYAGENENAVPAQQLLLLPGEKVPSLFALFKGSYEVRLKKRDHKTLARYPLIVK